MTRDLTIDQAVQESGRLLRAGKHADAERLLLAVLNAASGHFAALHLLSVVRWYQGQVDAAIPLVAAALAIAPHDHEAWANLGSMLHVTRRTGEAISSYRRALATKADYHNGLSNLAIALESLVLYDPAIVACRKALAIKPDSADVLSNLGGLLCHMGLVGASTNATRRALAVSPAHDRARRNLLAISLYDYAQSPAERFALHRRYGVQPALRTKRLPLKVKPDPDRIIRVGYLASDFYGHPLGRNVLPIVLAHDPRCVATYLYSLGHRDDDVTARFRAAAQVWRSIPDRRDHEIAAAIADDRIDVLVILGGHFDENRLQVARYRPAPVIVSLHDAATSGLSEVDYLLADPVIVPRTTEERFSERILRVPNFYLYEPKDESLVPTRPARAADQPIIFASLNNPAKLNEVALELWGDILGRVPGSRLLFQYRDRFTSPRLIRRVSAILSAKGVDPDRLDFIVGAPDRLSHRGLYDRIDIALDCFPFNGVTTTYESLSMGVPVVALEGRTMVSRTSMSFLKRVGLDDLVASTPEDYVATAVRLANDTVRLLSLRTELRSRLHASPLCAAARTTTYIERAYRAMWRRWCRQRAARR